MGIPTRPNKTRISTASDCVQTPNHIAELIVKRYSPSGKILEPCCGDGAFLKHIPGADWCEIKKGRDFFDYKHQVDWIITNPPYSIYDKFISHCFELSKNVVLLVPIAKAFKSMSIERLVDKYGGLKEIWLMGGGSKCGFSFGFPTGCLYYKKNYHGKITRFVGDSSRK